MAENILAYKSRTRFSPDMQLLQNHIAIYGASLETQKVMLTQLKCQIFCFWSCLPDYLDNKYNLQKSGFVTFQYTGQNIMSKIKKSSRSWEKCIIDRQADRQKDGLMNSTDFIEPLLQRQRFHHVFQKFENKTLNHLAWLWALWKESIQKIKYNYS